MRHQLRPPGPGAGIGRIARIAGRQDRLGAPARGGGAGRGEPVAEDGLGEPVHLQPAVIDANQRLSRHVGQGLPPGQRVGSPRRKLVRQHADAAGEQVLRNRLWCRECAQTGQLRGGWVVAGQPVCYQSGGGRQRPRVGARRALVKQLPGPRLQQAQVLTRQRAGVGDEPGGLGDGQRQVAELGGEPVRVGLGEPGNPAPQQLDRFGPGEHVDLDRRGDLIPATLAGRDQRVPAAPRQPWRHIRRRLRIVEDQQPSVTLPQLGQHRGPRRLGPGSGRNASEHQPEAYDLVPDQPILLSVDPPGQVIA